MLSELEKIKVPNQKFVITGGGRVAHGAMEVLEKAGIEKVSPEDFLNKDYDLTECFAMGKKMLAEGKPLVAGTFSKKN